MFTLKDGGLYMILLKKQKKIGKLLLAFAFLLSAIIIGTKITAAENDYSNQVTIVDWDILDTSGNPLSDQNGARNANAYQLSIAWSLNLSDGDVLHEGDTFTIQAPTNASFGSWTLLDSSYVDFVDQNGVIMGQFRMERNQINVVLSDNVEGLSMLSGSFITGTNALRNSTIVGEDILQDVQIGEVSKPILFYAVLLAPIPTADAKWSVLTSNSQINWVIALNQIGVAELSQQPWGSQFTLQNNTYIEDTLYGTYSNDIRISTSIFFPVDLQSGTASGQGIALNVTSFFTEITPLAGETYNDFKNRLQPLEYGIYTDADDIQTIIVFFGTIGDNNLKYSEVNSNFAQYAATNAISSDFYQESDRDALVDYFNQTYGDTNVIQGNLSNYKVFFTEEYEKVVVDTTFTNTATITKNGNSNDVSGDGVLQGNMGDVIVPKNTAGLFLYDEDTNELLQGATFKLQYQNSGSWEDFEAQPILTTDEDGFAQSVELPAGTTFRFLQLTTASDDYDLTRSQGYDATLGTVVSEEFIIDASEAEGHRIPVSNAKYRFTVTYEQGTHGLFESDIHEDIIINTKTPAYSGAMGEDGKPLGQERYVFAGWLPEVSQTVREDVTYVAQWKVIEYPIEYILDGGTNNPNNPQSYVFGVGVSSFKNATKENHIFLGWFDADDNEITSISETTSGLVTLYAHWEAIPYEEGTTSNPPEHTNPASPLETGDTTNTRPFLSLAMLSSGIVIVLLLRKTEKEQ